jgi:hypothetical protein
MRSYSGHSSARASNALYRANHITEIVAELADLVAAAEPTTA